VSETELILAVKMSRFIFMYVLLGSLWRRRLRLVVRDDVDVCVNCTVVRSRQLGEWYVDKHCQFPLRKPIAGRRTAFIN